MADHAHQWSQLRCDTGQTQTRSDCGKSLNHYDASVALFKIDAPNLATLEILACAALPVGNLYAKNGILMFEKFTQALLAASITLLVGCAGVTEFDTYIIDKYRAILEKNESCNVNANNAQVIHCARRQLAEMQSTPESYLKPAFVKYAKSFLDLVVQSKKMSEAQFKTELQYIVKVRDEEAVYAAKAERRKRDSDFMRRLGNAGQAYNESMRQTQPQSPTRCNSQTDGMGGFTTVCR